MHKSDTQDCKMWLLVTTLTKLVQCSNHKKNKTKHENNIQLIINKFIGHSKKWIALTAGEKLLSWSIQLAILTLNTNLGTWIRGKSFNEINAVRSGEQ